LLVLICKILVNSLTLSFIEVKIAHKLLNLRHFVLELLGLISQRNLKSYPSNKTERQSKQTIASCDHHSDSDSLGISHREHVAVSHGANYIKYSIYTSEVLNADGLPVQFIIVNPSRLRVIFYLINKEEPSASQKVAKEVNVEKCFEHLHNDVELIVFERLLSSTEKFKSTP
jgi:hypothetical protein